VTSKEFLRFDPGEADRKPVEFGKKILLGCDLRAALCVVTINADQDVANLEPERPRDDRVSGS
jgi:hypothetical protein